MITPERQMLYEKYRTAVGRARTELARELTKSQLRFMLIALEDPSTTVEAIAAGLHDIATLITAPPGAQIIFAIEMPGEKKDFGS